MKAALAYHGKGHHASEDFPRANRTLTKSEHSPLILIVSAGSLVVVVADGSLWIEHCNCIACPAMKRP